MPPHVTPGANDPSPKTSYIDICLSPKALLKEKAEGGGGGRGAVWGETLLRVLI